MCPVYTETLSLFHVDVSLSSLFDEILKQTQIAEQEASCSAHTGPKVQSVFITWPLAQLQRGDPSALSPVQY